ncbi:MAG: DUF502 domain-containing protein, partial [bacterium]|nr:DUF502 domain-containing protein [bacterium]
FEGFFKNWLRIPKLNIYFPGLGIIATIALMLVLGTFTTNFFGRYLLQFSDKVFSNTPIVKNIYLTIKQLMDAFMSPSNSAFKQVVLIEYPRAGIFVVGFLTGTMRGEVQDKTQEEMVAVFLPTTPNPTSGMLVIVPRKDVTLLHMSVEEGLKLIVSGGVFTPSYAKSAKEPSSSDDVSTN